MQLCKKIHSLKMYDSSLTYNFGYIVLFLWEIIYVISLIRLRSYDISFKCIVL